MRVCCQLGVFLLGSLIPHPQFLLPSLCLFPFLIPFLFPILLPLGFLIYFTYGIWNSIEAGQSSRAAPALRAKEPIYQGVNVTDMEDM